MGPGWYEDQYLKTLGKLGDGPLSFVPWYDPNKKLSKQLEAALGKKYPGVNLNTNHVYTFEALLVAADAYKRAKSADPKALADAIRATNITDNVSTGPGISFNAKGQNDKLKNSAIQNRGGKLVTVAPKGATNAKAEWPMIGLRQAPLSCSLGAGRHLSQRRGQRASDRPRLWADGARPVGDLRRRAGGQFRPRRDDDDRDVSRGRAVRAASASIRC